MTQEKDKYAFYLRKSRADIELEKKSPIDVLKNHEIILNELAKSLNITNIDIYREIVSGETINSRPIMQNLLEQIENGKYQGVLVVEVERLARGNTMDQGIIAQTFKYTNTKIITPTKIYDPNDEFDEEYFEFGLFMSRREYKTINRRIQRGRLVNSKKGLYVGSVPPYGYNRKKLKGEKGFKLIINKKEAEIVKTIFELYLNENMGTTKIANYLNNLKIKPRKNNKWTAASIRNILQSPSVKGYITWNKRKSEKNLQNGTIVTSRPINKNHILVKGLHKPIIDEKTWNKVNQKLSSKKTPRVKSEVQIKNPLAGLIICSKCNKKMIRRPHYNGYQDTLICPTKGCKTVSSSLNIVEDYLIISLQKYLKNYKYYLKINPKPENNNKLNLLTIEIENTKKQIEKSYDLVEEGIYTSEVFSKRITVLNNKLDILTTEKSTLEKEKNESKYEKINSYVPKLTQILNDYPNIKDNKDKNLLLASIIEKVIYTKNIGGKEHKDDFILKIYPKL